MQDTARVTDTGSGLESAQEKLSVLIPAEINQNLNQLVLEEAKASSEAAKTGFIYHKHYSNMCV